MKRVLLCSTALAGATAMTAGAAGAAEPPTWKLTGNMNFQGYWIDQDLTGPVVYTVLGVTETADFELQDHKWYFGVDEAELQLNVSGTADNGLVYGFKVEINANTTDDFVADEARLELSGGWGTLQMGDEDGAEDIMNYGGENLMGATGAFDGDQEDVLQRWTQIGGLPFAVNPTSYPDIAGDTSDATKISYFTPRFVGIQLGGSLTPQPELNGDDFKVDGAFENHVGLGANYDNTFGAFRVRASGVYSGAKSNDPLVEDISAWSVGAIVGFGPVSVAGNYTDNRDSGTLVGTDVESKHWNAAVGFETGPLYLSAGYFESTLEAAGASDATYKHGAVTADYTLAPGLGVYAEVNRIKDEALNIPGALTLRDNDATLVIVGANVSF